ncbi:TPA: hypothetical protein ACH3X2_14262 [Trebouxia sp. C0005]
MQLFCSDAGKHTLISRATGRRSLWGLSKLSTIESLASFFCSGLLRPTSHSVIPGLCDLYLFGSALRALRHMLVVLICIFAWLIIPRLRLACWCTTPSASLRRGLTRCSLCTLKQCSKRQHQRLATEEVYSAWTASVSEAAGLQKHFEKPILTIAATLAVLD